MTGCITTAAMDGASTEDDIEALIEDMEYIPGHFHLDLHLNCEPRGPADIRSRDVRLKRESLRAELEAESGPQQYAVRNLLGLLAFHLDEPERAEEAFRSICEEEPDNINAWANLGHIYDQLKRETEGAGCVEKVSMLMALASGEVAKGQSRLPAARCLAEQAYAHLYDVELDKKEDLRERLTVALTLYHRALDFGGQKVRELPNIIL